LVLTACFVLRKSLQSLQHVGGAYSLASAPKEHDVRASLRRVLTARNKIEDGFTWPEYINTKDMVADIGTKAISDGQFTYLRNLMNEYAMLMKHHPTYALPHYMNWTINNK
jgi:hypothetical protein